PEGEGWIVTARAPWSLLETISREEFVHMLEGPELLRPAMKATLQEMAARRDLLPPLRAGSAARGVVIGVIDYGCAFAHHNFRRADDRTRLLALWDQKAAGLGDDEVDYGRLYRAAEIDDAIVAIDKALQHAAGTKRLQEIYQAVGYELSPT